MERAFLVQKFAVGGWGSSANLDRINSHWSSDVFEFFLAEIDERIFDSVARLAISVLGKADTAWISNSFQVARRC